MSSGGGSDETLELRPRSDPREVAASASASGPSEPRVGRYTLGDELGRGGMGVVFRAWDTSLQRAVALKTLRRDNTLGDTGPLRLLREARTASQLHHPSIVELYDCFEEDGRVFLTMRLVEGEPLSRILREQGPRPPEQAARITLALARALEHAHAAGVTHRDIKPGNVLMERGEPVLTDFGLARLSESGDPDLTRESQVLGTPAYMAPELIRQGSAAAGPASDQYALGVVLYEMLAGRPHVRGGSAHEILAAILSGQQEPLPSGVPFQLAWICGRAMAPRPEDRFRDMSALAAALERYLSGQRVVGPRERLSALARQASRRLWIPALVVGLLVIALVGERLLALWWRGHEAGARAERAEARRATMESRVDALRAEGKKDEASALFRSYAELPENQETAALGLAWLGEGRRRQDDGDADGAEHAFTLAYGLTSDGAVQEDALLALAEDFRSRDQWDRLRSVLAVLSHRDGAGARTPRDLRRDLAASEGDLATARALNDDPELEPLLLALSQVTPLEQQAALALPLDDDGDGRPELGLLRYADLSLTVLDSGPTLGIPRYVLDLSPYLGQYVIPKVVQPWSGVGALMLLEGASGCALATARGGALDVVAHLSCKAAQAAALADLDQDGQPELLLANDRELEAGALSDPARTQPIDSTVNHTNSEIRGLVAGDLDGDGALELAVATGGWGAYDLRVLRRRGERWAMLDRVQLGELRTVRWAREGGENLLVTLQIHEPDQPLNNVVFGHDTPQTSPRGVYAYAWAGDRLAARGSIPWPTPPERIVPGEIRIEQTSDEDLLVGDLDGDGNDEIAVGIKGLWTWLYRRTAAGSWASVALDGYRPLAFIDLDGDGDRELVLRETSSGKAYIVGAGDQALPRAQRAAPVPLRPPEGLDPDMRAAWSRTEDLVALGMVDQAADRFLTLADLGAGTPARGLALMRAATILRASRPADAGRLLEQASDEPQFAAPALEAAFDMDDSALRTEEAIAVGERRVALPAPPPALVARLAVLRARAATPSLDLVSPGVLHPAWRFDQPETPRVTPEGMRLSWAGEGVIGRVPVRWLGGPVGVEVTLRTLRQDWSAWLDIGLDVRFDRHLARGISVPTTGGGGLYQRTMVCSDAPGGLVVGLRPEGISRIRWTYDPVQHKETCSIEDGAGREIGRTVYESEQGDPPLESWFMLRELGQGAVSDLLLSDLRLTGFALRDLPAESAARTNGLLARGDPAAALAAAGPGPSLARLLALDELGRDEEADATLRAALRRDPTLGGARSRLLLLQPDHFGPPLRSALGRAWDDAFLDAFLLLTQAYPGDPASQRVLTTLLPGLERAPISDDACLLLIGRSASWRLLGDPVRAEEDARVAAGMAERLHPSDPSDLRSRAQRQLALALVAREDRDGAMLAVLEALRSAEAPEVLGDVLAHQDELAPLHGDPRWAQVEAARAGRGG